MKRVVIVFAAYELFQMVLLIFPFLQPVGLPIAWKAWMPWAMVATTAAALTAFSFRLPGSRVWLEAMAWISLGWTLLNGGAIVIGLAGLLRSSGWWIPVTSYLYVLLMLGVVLWHLRALRQEKGVV